jgi:hypothetical protein
LARKRPGRFAYLAGPFNHNLGAVAVIC